MAQRRIRIVEHMRDFDKLRKGRVTVRAFRSALSMCGLKLTLPEYRALERVYAAQGVADHVNYIRFCNHVDPGLWQCKSGARPDTGEHAVHSPNVH